MSSHFDAVFSESGLPGVLDTLGESVTFRAMLNEDEYEVTASVGTESQEEDLTDDREHRLMWRDFTFAAGDIPAPKHNDEIDLGESTYVIGRVEIKTGAAIRVRAWRKLSGEKTRRGQRGGL